MKRHVLDVVTIPTKTLNLTMTKNMNLMATATAKADSEVTIMSTADITIIDLKNIDQKSITTNVTSTKLRFTVRSQAITLPRV